MSPAMMKGLRLARAISVMMASDAMRSSSVSDRWVAANT